MTKEFDHPSRGVGPGDEVEDEASLEIEDGLRIEAKASFESGTSLVIGGVGLGAKAEASLEIGPRAAPELDINSTIERLGLMR